MHLPYQVSLLGSSQVLHLEENSKAALGLHRICGASGLDSLGVQVLVFEILIDTECTNNVDSNRVVVELTSIQLFK